MGRRPNRVVQLFFDRGRKLDDASNRYEQRCKKCGVEFHKGRQETLINHIAKKCPRISPQERENFILEGIVTPRSSRAAIGSISPITVNQSGLSGLEALAEVSRQHGQIDYATQQAAIADEFLNSDHGEQESSSPSVVGATHQHAWNGFSISSPYTALAHHGPAPVVPMPSAASYRMAEAALNVLDPPQNPAEGRVSLRDQLRDQALVNYSYGEASSLDETPPSHHIPETSQDDIEKARPKPQDHRESLVDYSSGEPPTLDANHSRHQFGQLITNQASDSLKDLVASPASETNTLQGHSDLADYVHGAQYERTNNVLKQSIGNGHTTDLSMDSDTPMKDKAEATFEVWDTYNPSVSQMVVKKVRGKFAPDRRTAVKEVRKKGACLRCRMLKKSCDSGDPCNECAKLETARLWKGQCVRTRLNKIFEIYGSGLFMVLCHRAVEAARLSGPYEVRTGRLEVRYFPVSGITMTFPYAEIYRQDGSSLIVINIDNDNQLSEKLTLGGRPLQYAAWLLEKHQHPKGKIFKLSKFMSATLSLALGMDQRVLVTKVLELWACTTLMSFQPCDLTAFVDVNQEPTDILAQSSPHGTNANVPVDIIYLQLRRALEHCADALFKVVMVEIEKSLIQRKQSDNFETFIGTVLLLRCVEQMCHLYRSLDTSEEIDAKTSINGDTYKSPYKSSPRNWPLDKPPHYFWQQGERFSDLLCSMLRLRKVPPKTEVRDGVFVAIGEPARVRQWYETIQLKVETLKEVKTRPFDADDESAWEFRWIAKAFLKIEV